MAELLVWHGENYMDLYDQAKIQSLDSDKLRKYNAKYQHGAIIEVHEDGWSARRKGFGKNKGFSLVKVNGYQVEDVEHYCRFVEYDLIDNNFVVTKKSRYYLNMERVGLSAPGEILIDGPTFVSALEDSRDG